MAKSKKELDKDIMYSKIMPSSLIPSEESASASEPEPEQPLPSAPPAVGELASLRTKLFRHPAEEDAAMPVNLMEYAVADRLEEAFSRFNCCKCDRCKRDVAAVALNKLSPHYVVAPSDQLEGLAAQIPGQEVAAALVQAILMVRTHPRH